MPRRKWLKLIGSTIAASTFIRPSPAQKPTAIDVTIDEGAGAPESWEGSHPLSPFSSLNLSTGNLFTSIPIVSFSGRGLSVSLTLFHNSASSSSLQPFGYGWTHSYNWKIQQDSQTGDAIVVRGTGRKHRYTYNAQSGTFTPPAGVYDELVRHPDGTWTLTFKDQTKMHFDSSGKLLAIVDKNGNQITLSYDSYGRLTQVQEASGKVLSFGYANSGSGESGGSGGFEGEFGGGESVDTKVRTVTDPRGKVWQFSYDAYDRLTSITDPMGFVISFSYDAYRRITSITDKRGFLWQYGYDSNGKVVWAKHPDTGNAQISISWDNIGVTITDQDGVKVRYEHNDADELVKAIAGYGSLNLTTQYAYDANHNLVQVTTPKGYVWQYGYDSKGNLTSVTDPLGRTTTMTYDEKNNLTSVTTPSGKTTYYAYDQNGNLVQVQDAMGNITTYTYDAYGNRTSQTVNGHTTQFSYDASGNLTSITDPEGNKVEFGYNEMGWRVWRKDALSRITNYAYDDLGRLTQITYPDGSVVSFSYDAMGNMTQMQDGTGTTSWAYDGRGLKVQESKGGFAIVYAYSAAGRLINRTDWTGSGASFSYDAAGRLVSFVDAVGETSYTYDADGNLVQQVNVNGTVEEISYDAAGQVTEIVHKRRNGQVLGYLSYGYNQDGLVSDVVEGDGSVVTYNYDPLFRLISEQRVGSYAYSVSYEYDGAGNRLAKVWDGQRTDYVYDAADRLQFYVKPDGSVVAYDWDANGNMIARTEGNQTTEFEYDYDNRLVRIVYPNGSEVRFGYDGLGRRVFRQEGANVRYFYYDGDRIIAEREGSFWVVRYLLGLKPCGYVVSGQVRVYHADRLGSVRWVTDGSGNLVASYVYEGFGKIVGQGGSEVVPYRFCGLWGYRNDGDAGLLHVGARYYEVETGRWVQKEPNGWQGYLYCHNDPINKFDFNGLDPRQVERKEIPIIDKVVSIEIPVIVIPPSPPPPIPTPRPPRPIIIPLPPTEREPWIGIIRPAPGTKISLPFPDPKGPSDWGFEADIRIPIGDGNVRIGIEKPPGRTDWKFKIGIGVQF
jgi:RHS repeat-associated protein